MNNMLQASLLTLNKSEVILKQLSNTQLSDTSVSPYYSSIGSHLRHILDFYDCIFKSPSHNEVDLTARSRNKAVEENCHEALNYLKDIIDNLKAFQFKEAQIVHVIDDLGTGKIEIPYTYGALLSQANSHTIHHYAIVNYIFDRLHIKINDSDFGFNPSTPKESLINK
ncbi:hypothetical protein [Pseudotamlana carrageenivorans]|uniref:DinB family protein n=1 Tax=Pseudotamlana carrageenivorans TaxID=2069432 RepID=A0A2I7SMS3_9FLAO|nr:hypothetical protein [Tamlana carrageenivorans]AUS07192.1 hypothetical protein C1A40_17920 [Tamlana carrageenivorans]